MVVATQPTEVAELAMLVAARQIMATQDRSAPRRAKLFACMVSLTPPRSLFPMRNLTRIVCFIFYPLDSY